MGTSCNYGGGPNWSGAKNAVTRSSGAGHLTPTKAAGVVGGFVGQLKSSGSFGRPQGTSPGHSGSQRRSGGEGGGGGGGGGRGGGRSGRRSSRSSLIGSGPAGAAQRVGEFVADVKERGLKQALENLGMESCDGRTPAEIANFLADALGGPASTIDAVDLRAALSDLIENLMQEAADLDAMENNFTAAADSLEEVIRDLFGLYIVERFATIMTAPIDERQGVDVTDAYLNEIRAYVDTRLKLIELDKPLSTLDWRGAEGAAAIEDILNRTVTVFEGPNED